MNVQELFRKSDPEIVFHTYTLIGTVFDDFDNHTIQEHALELRKLREYIKDVCIQMGQCRIEKSDKAKTVFVIGRTNTSWGESYKKEMEIFMTIDEEAEKAVMTNFTMWNDDGDTRLEFYGIDFESISTIAGYTIAEPSVSEYGVDVCCAVILKELFVWGLTEKQREENHTDLIKRLDEAEKNFESGKFISSEEFDEWIEAEILKDSSDDEKEHRKYELEYEKNVEQIEARYREEIIRKDHKRFIDMVRNEYTNRK